MSYAYEFVKVPRHNSSHIVKYSIYKDGKCIGQVSRGAGGRWYGISPTGGEVPYQNTRQEVAEMIDKCQQW